MYSRIQKLITIEIDSNIQRQNPVHYTECPENQNFSINSFVGQNTTEHYQLFSQLVTYPVI